MLSVEQHDFCAHEKCVGVLGVHDETPLSMHEWMRVKRANLYSIRLMESHNGWKAMLVVGVNWSA